MGSRNAVLKIIAVLWVVWGVVHLMAGILVTPADSATAIGNIADAVDKNTLTGPYPPALSGILSQHGWNLGWFGLSTIIGGVLVWRGNRTAIWFSALVGGLADLGYFMFLDLPDYVNFMPGTLMTLVSGSAIVLSAWAWRADAPAAS